MSPRPCIGREKQDRIRELAKSFGARAISRRVGVNINTVKKYMRK